MLPPLMLMSFKAKDVALKYVWFLKIDILASDQERTIFIVLKFEYAQCICGRAVQLKPLFSGISSEWYSIFVPYDFKV